jgi:enoyl-CoA hydratase/carnithine racemase
LTQSLVRLEKQGAVSIITLDNPPVNAASSRLMNQLHELLDQVERDKEARCVILAAAGEKAFCAGGDLREEGDFGTVEASRAFRALGRKTLNRLETFKVPVVVAIHGYCIGGGTAIAWACDIRIAADNTVFRAGDA